MSVVIETTLGDITVDLYLEQRPASCLNFLKLCKMKYYNFNLFHTIRNGFIAQTGDPTGEGSGGQSIWGLLEGPNKRFFSGEKMPKIRHTDAGLLSMVCTDDMMIGSQFFFTLAPDLDSLDGVHCVIGEVTEGHEVLTKLNEVICDETHRPYQDVRITHTVILEDPFNDLPGLRAPSRSPSPSAERLKGGRIAPDEEIDETQGKSHQEIQEMIEEKEAKARATILEIVGDLPDADIAPPENVLFVCKLNPVTTDDDLEIIFSRFGKIVSCEVIRDKKTGDSLQYAFIEFEDKKSCEEAYFKMDNVLIDDRRIHVDFSQSVSKMRWLGKGRGVQYFNEKDTKQPASQHTSTLSSKDHQDSRRQHYKERDTHKRNDKDRIHKDDRDRSHKDDRERTQKDNRHNNEHRERKRSRSNSRKERPSNRYTKTDKNNSHENLARESRHERTHKIHVDNKVNRNENNIRHDNYERNDKRMRHSPDRYNKESSKNSDNYDKNNKTTRPSPEKYDMRENSRSLIRNERMKGHKRSDEIEKRERNNEIEKHERNDELNKNKIKHSSKKRRSYERDEKNYSNHKKRKHNRDSSLPAKKRRKSNKSESLEVEPHTPSPVLKKSKAKLKKTEKDKAKRKRNMKKNKEKRKTSTSSSSSESDSSDSSTSSTESSSSSGEDRRKKRSKRKKRHYSSSSSSSSTSSSSSSSSSSSYSSSESSHSSSDNCRNKKRHKTKVNTTSKKPRKKL